MRRSVVVKGVSSQSTQWKRLDLVTSTTVFYLVRGTGSHERVLLVENGGSFGINLSINSQDFGIKAVVNPRVMIMALDYRAFRAQLIVNK